jgi:uncharacterized protein (DUF302 family)
MPPPLDSPAGDGAAVAHVSGLTFAATLARLRQAITDAGMRVFAEIDHAQGARDAGLEMPPTTVLIYGSPAGGTPLMLAAPNVALDLPLRVLIRERADGAIVILFHPAEHMLRQDGVPPELAGRLTRAQDLLISAISTP